MHVGGKSELVLLLGYLPDELVLVVFLILHSFMFPDFPVFRDCPIIIAKLHKKRENEVPPFLKRVAAVLFFANSPAVVCLQTIAGLVFYPYR